MSSFTENKLTRVLADRSYGIVGVVFRGIWLTFASLCLVFGIVMIATQIGSMGFGAWVIGGIICCLPILGIIFSFVRDNYHSGREEGSRHYTTTVTVTDTHVYANTTNHPFLYGILWMVVALFLCALIGPLLLFGLMIPKTIHFVRNIIDLAASR